MVRPERTQSAPAIFSGVFVTHFHSVVWIDHRVAHVYGFGRDGTSQELVKSHGPQHIHHKAGTRDSSGHLRDQPSYFREIAGLLTGAGAILILGPAQTKTEFKTFLDAHAPAVAACVVGVEPLDRESEGEVIAFARNFFARTDRMTPQR
jgi:stalled ribosome rescue protein Dom34